MSVDVGNAVAYLELDYSKYSNGLVKAGELLSLFSNNTIESGLRVQALGGAITGVGQMLNKGLTVPLLGVGVTALTVAANFEEGMSKVEAISGATASEVEQLSEKAKELGANTKFSATEASEAFSYMAMAGWKTTDMLNGIDGIMNLAAASGENLALVSDICTDAMTAFGLSADQSSRFADVLAAASSNANTNVAMLGESFKYVAPVAGAMGYSVEDTAVALGLMANSGIKASQAGTSLRQILLGLQGGVELATKSTDKWRIEVENSDGSMRNLNDVVVDLRAAFGDMTDAQKASNAEAIAGKIGMSGLLSIVNASEADFNKLTGAIDNSTGVAKKMADTMQNNLKGKITQFKSALEGAGIAIGENLIPALTKGVTKITDMVSAFNKLPPATQKNIVSVGATVAAMGPLMMIGGKLITGLGKTISLVSSVTSLAGSGLVASLGAVAGPLAAVGAGFYTWHEAMNVANRSAITSREDMSLMEEAIADLTGQVIYSKDELVEMGLVWEEFSKDISPEFQEAIKNSAKDIWDFQMIINELTLDGVITEEEANELVDRFNNVCESAIEAIKSRQDEIQSTFGEAFSVDGVIDENEQVLLDFFTSETDANISHVTSMQDEVNELRRKKREEGYEFTDADNQKIAEYYSAILQAELEAKATNDTELLYSQNQFNQMVKTMNAEAASELLTQKKEEYETEKINNNAYYDTLIQSLRLKMSEMNDVQKAAAEEQILTWEQQKIDKNQLYDDMWKTDIQTAVDSNEELLGVINQFNGKILDENDRTAYELLLTASKNYEDLNKITESGYAKLYNSTTEAWDHIYVKVDEKTGELIGCYDLNTQKLGAMTEKDASLLIDEVTLWNQTTEGKLTNMMLTGEAYIDMTGTIKDGAGEIVGYVVDVEDEFGNLKQTIVDTNKNPVNIQGNWLETINNAKSVDRAIQSIKDKTVTISINQKGYAAVKGSGYTPMYATGTESAMPRLASVAEYGPELIVGRGGEMILATGRQLMNMEGGENVYNARQTQEILKSMNEPKSNRISEGVVYDAAKMIVASIKGLDNNIESAIKETGNTTIVGDLGGEIDIDRIPMRELSEEISNYFALNTKGYR